VRRGLDAVGVVESGSSPPDRFRRSVQPAREACVQIGEVQRRAWENKLSKGFNVEDVPYEFGLLNAEVGEAFTAWRHDQSDFGSELADVLIYLTGLAEMTGVDLAREVERKLAVNERRTYRSGPSGSKVKESTSEPGQARGAIE